jgi:hypothetical protein
MGFPRVSKVFRVFLVPINRLLNIVKGGRFSREKFSKLPLEIRRS